MSFSDKTQRAALSSVIAMIQRGRIEGSADQRAYLVSVLEEIEARILRAEQEKIKREKASDAVDR